MLGGMTFHVLWHFGAGYAAYLNVLYLDYLRMYTVLHGGEQVEIRHVLFGWFVPYLYVSSLNEKGD
jgi:hypothetical protein